MTGRPDRTRWAADPDERARAGRDPDDEPPPILGSWGCLYAVVVLDLVLLIALCGWLTRAGR